MEKVGYKKNLKELYNLSAKAVGFVTMPKMNYLMIDGQGDPAKSKEFQAAIEALYPLAYNLKFRVKKEKGVDYGVMPLEGLWWADDMEHFAENRDTWFWTLMIMQPEFITKELVEGAIREVGAKKNPSALSKIRFESLDEGIVAQIMHIGPFSEEGPNIKKNPRLYKESE